MNTIWIRKSLPAALGMLLLLVALRNFWIGDDAYIAFRSLDQLFAGNGPRWNLVDRAQVYTSPLWFWLMALSRLAIRDVYLNAMVLSFLLMAATTVMALRQITNPVAATAFFASLLLSNAFMDYTGSGLEYPLIYLLVTAFFLRFAQIASREPETSETTGLMLVAGLGLVTRHDLLLLFIMPVAYLLLCRSRRKVLDTAVFIAPLCIWTTFSLVYYGLAFPNTAYAKLYLDVPRWQLLEQGLMFFYRTLQRDIFTLLVIAGGTALLLRQKENLPLRLTGLSVALSCGYIFWIGADFMAGRFFAPLFLATAIGLSVHASQRDFLQNMRSPNRKILAACAVFAFVAYGAFYPHTPLNSPRVYEQVVVEHGISDERGFYSGATSIWRYIDNKQPYFPDHNVAREALVLREQDPATRESQTPPIRIAIGIFGYWAPLDALIIDVVALPDVFRSRMPRASHDWAVGHTGRHIPGWYIESLRAGHALMTYDPALNEYFSAVSLLTQSDDLFAPERLLAIARFNLGHYEHLLHETSSLTWRPREQAYNAACKHPWQHDKNPFPF
jgi:arabinofuranosyltransferase